MEMRNDLPKQDDSKEVVEMLKGKYRRLSSLLDRLDKLTQKYISQGPLSSIKHKMKHPDFILLRSLTEDETKINPNDIN